MAKSNYPSVISELDALYGKVPPQAIEVEEAVVASFMLERDAIIQHHVDPVWFYKTEHQIIIDSILKLSQKKIPIDLLQVTTYLKNTEQLDTIGGASYITQLTRRVASAAHIEHHLRIVYQKYIRREIIRQSQEHMNLAHDESLDEEDILNTVQQNLSKISLQESNSIQTLHEGGVAVIKQARANLETTGLIGIHTGFKELNSFTGGWQEGDLVVVGAEPSQGKTSLCLDFIDAACEISVPSGIISMEMTLMQLSARMLSKETNIPSKNIMFRRLLPDQVYSLESGLYKMRGDLVFIDVSAVKTISGIVASIRVMVAKYGIKLAVVDYLQMIHFEKTKSNSDEQLVSDVVKSLKALALDLKITIFLVSQMRRDQDPIPKISRLKGSGQIEAGADVILMPYRPEFYNKHMPEPYDDIQVADGLAVVYVGKGRNIGTGQFILRFEKEITTFLDYNPY